MLLAQCAIYGTITWWVIILNKKIGKIDLTLSGLGRGGGGGVGGGQKVPVLTSNFLKY